MSGKSIHIQIAIQIFIVSIICGQIVHANTTCEVAFPTANALTSSSSRAVGSRQSVQRIADELVVPQDFSRLDQRVSPEVSEGFDLRNLVPDENRVVIGIESRKHAFMVVGKFRFDGLVLEEPGVVEYAGEIPVGRGVFTVLKNVPPGVVSDLRRLVSESSDESYLSCVHAVTSMLEKVGITTVERDASITIERDASITLKRDASTTIKRADTASAEPVPVHELSQLNRLIMPGTKRSSLAFRLSTGVFLETQTFATSDIHEKEWAKNLKTFDKFIRRSIVRDAEGLSIDELVLKYTGQPRRLSPGTRLYLVNAGAHP